MKGTNPNAGDEPENYGSNREDLNAFLHEKDVNQISIDYKNDMYGAEQMEMGYPGHKKINKAAYQKVIKSNKVAEYKINSSNHSPDKRFNLNEPSPEVTLDKPSKIKYKKKEEKKDNKEGPTQSEKIVNQIEESFKSKNKPPSTNSTFYRAGKVLGKGAFGKVSLAMHKLSKKLVALKLLNKEFLKNETSKEKVMQEVRILKRFRHPNVVKLFETFESDKHIVLVMEL